MDAAKRCGVISVEDAGSVAFPQTHNLSLLQIPGLLGRCGGNTGRTARDGEALPSINATMGDSTSG